MHVKLIFLRDFSTLLKNCFGVWLFVKIGNQFAQNVINFLIFSIDDLRALKLDFFLLDLIKVLLLDLLVLLVVYVSVCKVVIIVIVEHLKLIIFCEVKFWIALVLGQSFLVGIPDGYIDLLPAHA